MKETPRRDKLDTDRSSLHGRVYSMPCAGRAHDTAQHRYPFQIYFLPDTSFIPFFLPPAPASSVLSLLSAP